MKNYMIKKAVKPVNFAALLSSGVWDDANVAKIDNFREESSCHHPETTLRMLYNNDGIFGRFEVKDRYVRCVAEKFQDPVCLDSCVELFIEPAGNNGYINFEFSGAGVFLSSHIKDSRRTAGGFADYRMLTGKDAAGIVCASTLPRKTDPEITDDLTWELGFFLPFTVFERLGFAAPESQSIWRGNFFKCGDKTSHPHWASWNPVDELNFHLPRCFSEIIFE